MIVPNIKRLPIRKYADNDSVPVPMYEQLHETTQTMQKKEAKQPPLT